MDGTRRLTGWALLASLIACLIFGLHSLPVAAQDDEAATAEADQTQTEVDATAAALATDAYPFGTVLLLLDEAANVRAEAGTDAPVLSELDAGEFVTVQAGPEPIGDAIWYQIETEGGLTGWVESAAFGLPSGGVPLNTGDELLVATDSLNLRQDPGLEGEVVIGLVDGDQVTVVEGPNTVDRFDWYQVESAGGETGWLAGVYLAVPGAVGSELTVGFPSDTYVFVTSETLNLRAEASVEAEIVEILSEGDAGLVTGAPVADETYEWYPVAFGVGDDSVTGWVAGELVTGGIIAGSEAVVIDGPLNVRDDTSTDGDPVGQLETGAAVTILSGPTIVDDVAWFEVQSDDVNGYVAGRYLGQPE